VITALIFGACVGLLLGICGLHVRNWRFWTLLVAFNVAFMAGRLAP
jgi:hypothetical protein